MTVEDNVGKLQGIRSVKANISTGIVELSGEDFDLGQVREKIESLGYNYKGEADKLP
jgi:copper chaperone CopZ